MASLISLRPTQTKMLQVKHKLLKDVISYSDEEIDLLAAAARRDPKLVNSLCMALRACVKNLVGRYLFYWPASRPFQDDMVSECLLLISEFVRDIPESIGIMSIISRRMQDRINTYLNDNQSLSAPSLRQQKYLKQRGEEPIFRENSATEFDCYPEEQHPQDAGDEGLRDILDAFSMIQPEDELDVFLMDTSNWGRGYQELADELRVGVATIHRRKQRLYQKYLELTR